MSEGDLGPFVGDEQDIAKTIHEQRAVEVPIRGVLFVKTAEGDEGGEG